MSCRELEALFLSDAPPGAAADHRRRCLTCDALGRDLDQEHALVAGLASPPWSGALRQSLLAIPATTASCESAADVIAAAVEGELEATDRGRLEFQLRRCEACTETAATLGVVRELEPPRAAPWIAGKLASARPARKKKSPFGWLLDPKAAITLAYAATVVVMLAGWNPADLARRADVRSLEQSTKAAASVAGGSVVDRVGILQERVFRALEIAKGRFGGYGRAVLSNALNLVMRMEPEKERAPSRPKSGEEKGAIQKSESEIWTRRV